MWVLCWWSSSSRRATCRRLERGLYPYGKLGEKKGTVAEEVEE